MTNTVVNFRLIAGLLVVLILAGGCARTPCTKDTCLRSVLRGITCHNETTTTFERKHIGINQAYLNECLVLNATDYEKMRECDVWYAALISSDRFAEYDYIEVNRTIEVCE